MFKVAVLEYQDVAPSVIRVGVAYVNVHVLRHLKEELSWAIDKRLRLIINKMLFKTVIH